MRMTERVDERARLESLRRLNVLDTPAEAALDELTRLAAQICEAPMAVVSLVDEARQWFKSRHGVEMAETPRDISFCAWAIQEKDSVLEVRDAAADERFASSPLVVSEPKIRFYAGAPLVAQDGHALGALCVMDRRPRELNEVQRQALKVLSRQVVWHLELWRRARELERETAERKRAEELGAKTRQTLLSLLEDAEQAGEELKASEERFRELAENIDEVFWVMDAGQAKYSYISPAFETIWERPRSSLTAGLRSWMETVHPQDRERVAQAAAGSASGNYNEEYRILLPNGTVRWVNDRAFPIREEAGKIERIVGVARDVTSRKAAESALGEKTQLLEKAQEIGQIGSWSKELGEGNRLEWSDGTARIFGFEPGEFDGREETFYSMVKGEDVELVREAMRGALAGERGYEVAHRIVQRDGRERWVQQKADVERDEAGGPRRMVGVIQDVTERKMLEEQFRQSQKMEAIGRLAGGVAHDFNNILAVIMMQSELAQMGEDIPDPVVDSLEQIRAAAERAAKLTRQLLLFSRKQVMQPQDIDLNETVTGLAKMLQRIIGEDVRLEMHLHSAALVTRADAGMLDQVLMNLAVNARDAMPGGGRLLIETSVRVVKKEEAAPHPDSAPGPYVSLSVEDSGTGISPEVLPRIFEPFFTTKEAGKGTGLGLATVFGIVKQHSGWVTVASELGKGTRFEVFLRATGSGDLGASAPIAPAKPRGGTETILLVEDEQGVRMLTRILLERQGYRVLEAANGVEGMQVWEREKGSIRLLLTDMVMPEGISGRELAGQLQEWQPDLRVIFTSGYSADIAGRELNLKDGQNFLQKPCPPLRLLETVRKSLDALPK